MSSLLTRSVFYFGHKVDETNLGIDFSEGSGEIQANLNIGNYSLEEYSTEIARAMTAAGGQVYSVSVDRDTRELTISAPSSFELLFGSGTRNGISAASLMGFSASDTGSSTSHKGDTGSGSEYLPQFFLQRYIDAENNQSAISATVNESASGNNIETISFGNKKTFEMEITYITEIDQGVEGIIETDSSATSKARTFMSTIVNRGPFEFMPNRDARSTFHKVLLDSTPESQNGIAFKLKPFSQNMRDYLTTGLIRLRKLT